MPAGIHLQARITGKAKLRADIRITHGIRFVEPLSATRSPAPT
jgi:hypothetical protein